MDDNIRYEDLQQLFLGTVVLHKNRPVKVLNITPARVFKMTDLLTQKTENYENPVKDIQPPLRRLGMVNIGGGCIYAKRIPRRNYTIGFNNNNVKLDKLKYFSHQGGRDPFEKMCNFDTIELGECMFGRYPTFKECVKEVKQFAGTMAFDRQFAIDTEFNIWYRTQIVGSYVNGRKVSLENIQWKPEYEYLWNIIGDTHEKDLSVPEE